jgi:hypothetical protein
MVSKHDMIMFGAWAGAVIAVLAIITLAIWLMAESKKDPFGCKSEGATIRFVSADDGAGGYGDARAISSSRLQSGASRSVSGF